MSILYNAFVLLPIVVSITWAFWEKYRPAEQINVLAEEETINGGNY